MQVQPEQALFIGNDLYHDIFGAQQIGMKAILLERDQDPTSQQSITLDYVITRFAELPQAVNHFVMNK